MRKVRIALASALTGVAMLGTMVSATGSASAAPVAQINWDTRVEGATVVAEVSSGSFRRAGNAVELTDSAGTVVLRVPLTFKLAGRSIPFAADISDSTLRLTADQAQSAALGLAPVSPVPAETPVAASATAISSPSTESRQRDIPGAIELGRVIGAAVGGAIGFAAGCALGGLGTGAAVGATTAGILAVAGAIIGCVTAGVSFVQVGSVAGSAVGGGVGAVVGTLLPA
ncbi:hypothetical protein AB0G00_23460 [Nocardia salmonicida]|uniref:hypothetical protein n=1 Tax=Nocardia salmonicida TaxID=53431 RepID=UPI0033DD4142